VQRVGRYLEDFQPGEQFVSPSRTITETDVVMFAAMSGDYNEVHTSETWARERGAFGRRVAHGLLCLAVGHALMLRLGILEGTAVALLGIDGWSFTAPVFFGDTLHAIFRVAEARPSRSQPDRGIVRFDCEYRNQDGVVVQRGQQTVMVRRRPPA
jgi:acyl dehydratase